MTPKELEIRNEIKHLQRCRYTLECGSDFLFTNSRDLDIYQEQGKRIAELHKQLKELKKDS